MKIPIQSLSPRSVVKAAITACCLGIFVAFSARFGGALDVYCQSLACMSGTLPSGATVPSGTLSGVVASSVLPSTVAFTSVANTFTAAQTVNANIVGNSSITTSGGVFGVGGALTGTTSMSVPTGLLITGPLAAGIFPSTSAWTSVAQSWTAAQTIPNLVAPFTITAGSVTIASNNNLAVAGTGKFSVGTLNPTQAIHLSSGTFLIDGNTPAINITGINSTTNPFVVGVTTLVVQSGGNVGIGTSGPQQLLDVNGASQFGSGATKSTVTTAGSLTLASAALFRAGGPAVTVPGTVVINSTGAAGGDSIARIQDSGGSAQWIFLNNGELRAARADVQLIVQNTVDGSDTQGIQIGHANTSRGALTEYFGNEHANAGLLRHQAGNVSGGVMTFTTNNTERVRIDYAGLVGIGSVAPATKLHVSSGTLTIDGNTQLVANFGGTVRSWSRTKAQIDTLAAGAVGEIIFCSNCNTGGEICVSTGTAASQWHQIGRTSTIGCGSNE